MLFIIVGTIVLIALMHIAGVGVALSISVLFGLSNVLGFPAALLFVCVASIVYRFCI